LWKWLSARLLQHQPLAQRLLADFQAARFAGARAL